MQFSDFSYTSRGKHPMHYRPHKSIKLITKLGQSKYEL